MDDAAGVVFELAAVMLLPADTVIFDALEMLRLGGSDVVENDVTFDSAVVKMLALFDIF
jgi:hypothetical protein